MPAVDSVKDLLGIAPSFVAGMNGPETAWTMRDVGDAAAEPEAVAEVQSVLKAAGERAAATLDRLAFYERAAKAFAIFACGETRTYGNVLLRKGVLREADR